MFTLSESWSAWYVVPVLICEISIIIQLHNVYSYIHISMQSIWAVATEFRSDMYRLVLHSVILIIVYVKQLCFTHLIHLFRRIIDLTGAVGF